MTHHIIADEQTMIQRWLWQKGGPSLRPDWGALQPLYDQTIARNHRLVRLIATED